MNNTDLIEFHKDEDLFREALEFSAADTGFPARLVEKDYYCTLLLQYLMEQDAELVFKGGTCLAKVHSDFYRLSEDLDFSIPMPIESSRGQRRSRVQNLKTAVKQIENELPKFGIHTPMVGANHSAQYNTVLTYPSALIREEETVKIEIGLREPLLQDTLSSDARTIIRSPVTESPMVPAVSVTSLSWEEAMAEKLRAALTRREAAIRDFYDIYYAIRNRNLLILDSKFQGLVEEKLEVPGNDRIDVSSQRLEDLRAQVETELRSVLRAADFAAFDLDWTFAKVDELASEINR